MMNMFLILAVLHDLFEIPITLLMNCATMGIPEEIIEDLMILTKQKGDDYEKRIFPVLGQSTAQLW